MSTPPEIVNFADVVKGHLNGGKIVSYQTKYLTKIGDNYGSIMLHVSARVQRPDGHIEELPLIAKLPPINNDTYWSIFQPDRTCVAENAMYKIVAPALRQLQCDAGDTVDGGVSSRPLFDAFSRYYGSRIALDDAATTVDRSAVLVLENLQASGYRILPRRGQMFDYQQAMLILENLAQFHALPIALRLKHPQQFDQMVRPHYKRFALDTVLPVETKLIFLEGIIREVRLCAKDDIRVVERVKELYDSFERYLVLPEADDTIFTTIVHCDLWKNNIMVQFDERGLATHVKFIDFQTAQYDSLLHDVLFFLLSAVEASVFEANFATLLRTYYDHFERCLNNVGVSTDAYSYEAFHKELLRIAPVEVYHALNMVKFILAAKSNLPASFKDLDLNPRVTNSSKETIQRTAEIVDLACKFEFFY